MSRIVVIGDVMLDRYLQGRVDRISPEAPVPVFVQTGQTFDPGGAANVAHNLTAMGIECLLLGCVGSDYGGDALRDLLEAYGIPHCLVTLADRPTTTKTRYVCQGQQILRVDNEETAAMPREVEDEIIKNLKAVIAAVSGLVISDYAKGLMSPRLTRDVIALTREAHLPVIADPKSRDFSLYARATVLTPNARELAAATGMPTDSNEQVVEASWHVMDDIDIQNVLTTRAEHGMTLVGRDIAPVHFPTRAKEVYDVVGAGDTALAAFAAAFVMGSTLEQSVVIANAAAGIAVGKRGTAAVTFEEITELVRA